MNRLAVLAFLCLSPSLAAASDLRPGTVKLSGATNLDFSSEAVETDSGIDSEMTRLAVSTRGHWFATRNVGVGAFLEFERLEQELEFEGSVEEVGTTVKQLTVGPAVAFHLPLSSLAALFAEGASGSFGSPSRGRTRM